MNNYFNETLTTFLQQNALPSLSIQDLNTWRKNDLLKITVIIKKQDGFANLEECEYFYKLIKIWIKKENIQERVQIEVQSESIDKKLIHMQDFKDSIGTQLSIELKEKQENRRRFKGFLIQIKDDILLLKDLDNEYALNFHSIKKAKIIP